MTNIIPSNGASPALVPGSARAVRRGFAPPACRGGAGGYSRSSARTPSSAPANRRAVLGLTMRRSSSKSEMELADTPLLAESSRMSIPQSSRTRLSFCSRGMGCSYPAICPGEREPSGRPDDRGLAGSGTAAVFRAPSLTSISESSEERTTREKERIMSTETKTPDYAVLPRKAAQRHRDMCLPAEWGGGAGR